MAAASLGSITQGADSATTAPFHPESGSAVLVAGRAIERKSRAGFVSPRPLLSAQGGEAGVTPEMLVVAAEQVSRDQSLTSKRD